MKFAIRWERLDGRLGLRLKKHKPVRYPYGSQDRRTDRYSGSACELGAGCPAMIFPPRLVASIPFRGALFLRCWTSACLTCRPQGCLRSYDVPCQAAHTLFQRDGISPTTSMRVPRYWPRERAAGPSRSSSRHRVAPGQLQERCLLAAPSLFSGWQLTTTRTFKGVDATTVVRRQPTPTEPNQPSPVFRLTGLQRQATPFRPLLLVGMQLTLFVARLSRQFSRTVRQSAYGSDGQKRSPLCHRANRGGEAREPGGRERLR